MRADRTFGLVDKLRSGLRRARLALLACVVLVAGPATAAMEMSKGEAAEVTGAKTGMVFASGKNVHVAVTSTHDVFAAGNTIRVDQTTADHVFAAGETITFTGVDLRNAIAAGKHLDFETGQTQADAVVFGESLTFRPSFKINGSLVAMGQTLELQAPVGGEVFAAGRDVTINSAVTGDVKVEGQHVIIGPNARIGGGLSYRANSIEISPQAVITGPKVVLPPRTHHHHGKLSRPETLTERITGEIFGFVAFAILALGLVLLFPGLMGRAGGMIGRNPLMAVLIGLGVMILGPAVALVLAVTLLGAPLAATLVMVLLTTILIGLAAGAAGLGMLIRRLAKRGTDAPKLVAQLGWTLLGAVVLCALGEIPIVGGWLWLVVCVLGAGAVAIKGRSALAAHD